MMATYYIRKQAVGKRNMEFRRKEMDVAISTEGGVKFGKLVVKILV